MLGLELISQSNSLARVAWLRLVSFEIFSDGKGRQSRLDTKMCSNWARNQRHQLFGRFRLSHWPCIGALVLLGPCSNDWEPIGEPSENYGRFLDRLAFE
jgi:hypothetical protein